MAACLSSVLGCAGNESAVQQGAGGGATIEETSNATRAGSGGADEPEPSAGGSGGETIAPDGPEPMTDQTVIAFEAAHVYFAGDDNQRRVDTHVSFPAAGPWKRVTLKLSLSCPQGRCDFWDRWGYLALVSDEPPDESLIEIQRFVTPFFLTAG